MFGTLIDYWYYTGDATYNKVTMQAMMHQMTDEGDFMPSNQTRQMGNDDQGFWALSAMMAAENVFPNPPSDKVQWLTSVQTVFNQYVYRWNHEVEQSCCNGGLRWQVYSFNLGYSYKNSIANGIFFNLASRLARFTGNSTYADWATKIYNWQKNQGLISDQYSVYDGINVVETTKQCQNINYVEFTYNIGLFLHGSAIMYNHTHDQVWKERVNGFLLRIQKGFLKQGILYEPACEPTGNCDLNMMTFKGYMLRFLAATTLVAAWTGRITSGIISDAGKGAAAVCNGPITAAFHGINETACGFEWTLPQKYDGRAGVGPQMDALCSIIYNLIDQVQPPATSHDRGISKGNPDAGIPSRDSLPRSKAITIADKVGAAILTIVMSGVMVGALIWLMLDIGEA